MKVYCIYLLMLAVATMGHFGARWSAKSDADPRRV